MLGACLLALTAACAEPVPEPFEGPLDHVLRLNHVQLRGTHNSYHLAPVEMYDEVPAFWDYTHAPIREQLEKQGVRKLELDLWWDEELQAFRVLHVPILDPYTTCEWFSDCLGEVRAFSDDVPWHLPIFLFIETKDSFGQAEAVHLLDHVEKALLAAFPRERFITPDEIQGDSSSLVEAVATRGWPTLGEVRGRIVAVLHDSGAFREAYSENQTTLRGRLMFTSASAGMPIGAIRAIDGPVNREEIIQEAVGQGVIIRTRSDTPGDEAFAADTTRQEAALRSGAHVISTDYPWPVDGVDYVLDLPGVPLGAPARCNPVTAPPECEHAALEPF